MPTAAWKDRGAGASRWLDGYFFLCFREEDLIPLHLVAGAARDDAGTVPLRGAAMGCWTSGVRFG